MDTVGAFIAECCVQDPELETPSKRLHDRYREWCNAHGETPMSMKGFSARLGEKGFAAKRTKTARGWRGLGLGLTVTQVTH
jgi:putative DNA primase/helicase